MNAKTTEAAGVKRYRPFLQKHKDAKAGYIPTMTTGADPRLGSYDNDTRQYVRYSDYQRLEAALATLQSRLLAADELREATERMANAISMTERLTARYSLREAIAAYDKAGRGKEAAHG